MVKGLGEIKAYLCGLALNFYDNERANKRAFGNLWMAGGMAFRNLGIFDWGVEMT